ncbi:hypothetical protein CKO21_04925 [Rhodovibrio salinarum]|uniref:DUF1826 domain-containing protein n=2 Tax=Rhodovibrio salinarum TaxID=1087 RepID=A0A934UZN2_9PROT|nr:hypothetical protein [Rhodovibrio salinarum]
MSGAYVRVGPRGSILFAAREEACVLALWHRQIADCVARELDRLAFDGLPAFDVLGGVVSVRAEARAAIDRSALAGSAMGRWLESDIAGLCCRYAAVTGGGRMHVRLAAIDDDACRYFHVDRLSMRLLCTYRGPGTQWVAPETSVRGTGGPEVTSVLEAAPHLIRQVPTRSIALFRGRTPDTQSPGLLHRSPPPAQGNDNHRLVLTVSTGGAFA